MQTTTYYQQSPPPPPPYFEAPPPPTDGTFHPKDVESSHSGNQRQSVEDTKYRDPVFIVLFVLTLATFGIDSSTHILLIIRNKFRQFFWGVNCSVSLLVFKALFLS
jgi:hypothetical protein